MTTSYFDKIQGRVLSPSLYEPKKLKGLKRLMIAFYIGTIGVMISLLCTISEQGEPESMYLFPFVMAAVIMLFLGELIAYTVTYKTTLCKALAGLEEGYWHCAEDLQLWLNIPMHIGKRLVSGDYDDLLRDELTCKFIGK